MSQIYYYQVKTGRLKEGAEEKPKDEEEKDQIFTDDNVPAKYRPYLDREIRYSDYIEML